MIFKKVSFILLFCTLFSCATPYQKLNKKGGYSEEKINDHVYRVSFQGNTHTKDDRVYDYFLRRSAELALENNFSFFIVMEAEEIHKPVRVTTEGNAAANTDPTVPQTTGAFRAPVFTKTLIKHAIVGQVVMFREGEEPIDAIRAKDIVEKYKVRR